MVETAARGEGYEGLPVVTPEERKALSAAHAAFEAGLAGTSADHIDALVGTLAIAYPQSKAMTDNDAAARLALYERGLGDLPPDMLTAAVEASLKVYTHFPTIAEIRKLLPREYAWRRNRSLACRRLIFKHDRDYVAPPVVEKLRPLDVPKANALMRQVGARTRYRPDGSPYQLADEEEAHG